MADMMTRVDTEVLKVPLGFIRLVQFVSHSNLSLYIFIRLFAAIRYYRVRNDGSMGFRSFDNMYSVR